METSIMQDGCSRKSTTPVLCRGASSGPRGEEGSQIEANPPGSAFRILFGIAKGFSPWQCHGTDLC